MFVFFIYVWNRMKQSRNGGQAVEKGPYVKYVSFNYFMCSNLADFEVYIICILKLSTKIN